MPVVMWKGSLMPVLMEREPNASISGKGDFSFPVLQSANLIIG